MLARSLAELRQNTDLKAQGTFGSHRALQFTMHSKSLSNVDVRLAIAYMVDRDAIIKTALDGVGTPIWGIGIPEGYLGYSDAKKHFYKVEIAKSKAWMVKAGCPNGFEVRLLATSQYSLYSKMAVVLQSQLAQIGIKLKLDLPDWLSALYYGGSHLVRSANSAYFDDPQRDKI